MSVSAGHLVGTGLGPQGFYAASSAGLHPEPHYGRHLNPYFCSLAVNNRVVVALELGS